MEAQYEELTRRLVEGRARGEFARGADAEQQEDQLLEQMDDCWWQMTEAERDEADRRLEEARKMSAPELLDSVDVAVLKSSTGMPRRQAA